MYASTGTTESKQELTEFGQMLIVILVGKFELNEVFVFKHLSKQNFLGSYIKDEKKI